uniref:Uncharacterized protein n=1 Tax=Anopheles coluzzii TaxID=1518534 RepID=A0A8W7PP50_ANOCL
MYWNRSLTSLGASMLSYSFGLNSFSSTSFFAGSFSSSDMLALLSETSLRMLAISCLSFRAEVTSCSSHCRQTRCILGSFLPCSRTMPRVSTSVHRLMNSVWSTACMLRLVQIALYTSYSLPTVMSLFLPCFSISISEQMRIFCCSGKPSSRSLPSVWDAPYTCFSTAITWPMLTTVGAPDEPVLRSSFFALSTSRRAMNRARRMSPEVEATLAASSPRAASGKRDSELDSSRLAFSMATICCFVYAGLQPGEQPIGKIERVGNTDQDEPGGRPGRPFEDAVQDGLLAARQLIDLVQHQHDGFVLSLQILRSTVESTFLRLQDLLDEVFLQQQPPHAPVDPGARVAPRHDFTDAALLQHSLGRIVQVGKVYRHRMKPRQLARIISGSSSRPKSLIACAVLNDESGNHTWPACWNVFASESRLAGSAGMVTSTVRVSTAITPTGMPPSLARPVTTVWAHGSIISANVPRSKKPVSQSDGLAGLYRPASIQRGSYGALVGVKSIIRSIGSLGDTIGRMPPRAFGMYDSQCRIVYTPSRSSVSVLCVTPLLYMIWMPPS